MTREFGQQHHCAMCGAKSSIESTFSRWLRANDDLESSAGHVFVDTDLWVRRYKTALGREFQLLMLVEIKTHGAQLTDAQRDTLYMINQVMRNRRETPTKKLKHQAGTSPMDVYSTMLGRRITLKAFGMHVLTFSRLGPDDSQAMKWDNQPINSNQLRDLLAFDLDPDTLRPMDFRSHHSTNGRQMTLTGS